MYWSTAELFTPKRCTLGGQGVRTPALVEGEKLEL